MNPKALGLEGEYKHLDSTVPEGASRKATSVATMEATVDVKPQALLKIRPFQVALMTIPAYLKPETQIVLTGLLDCFDKAQTITEGLLGDLIWGFGECGIPPECTLVGLRELNKLDYVRFQAPDNSWIDLDSDQIGAAWIRYQKKILDMAYSD